MPNIDHTQRAHVHAYLWYHWLRHGRGPTIRKIARVTGVTVNVAGILREFEARGLVRQLADGKRIPVSKRLQARVFGD